MPLIKGFSRSSVSKNIETEIRAGRSQAQAVAIALSTAREAFKRRYPGKALPEHLRETRKRAKNPTETKLRDKYYSALSADKKLQKELEKIYGKRAGDARYLRQTYIDYPHLQKLLDKKKLADDAWLDEMRKNPAKRQAAPTDYVIRATDKKTGKAYYFNGSNWDADPVEASRWHDSALALKYAREIVALRGAKKIVDTSHYDVEVVSDPVKAKRGRGVNPVPLSRTTAVKHASNLYEDFTGHKADYADPVQFSAPDVALLIGECDGILYTTVRDGRTEKYIHKFKKQSRPLLAASSDGKQLVLIGGSYKFTERGIVDE